MHRLCGRAFRISFFALPRRASLSELAHSCGDLTAFCILCDVISSHERDENDGHVPWPSQCEHNKTKQNMSQGTRLGSLFCACREGLILWGCQFVESDVGVVEVRNQCDGHVEWHNPFVMRCHITVICLDAEFRTCTIIVVH